MTYLQSEWESNKSVRLPCNLNLNVFMLNLNILTYLLTAAEQIKLLSFCCYFFYVISSWLCVIN